MPRDYKSASPAAYQRLPEYTRDDAWIIAFLQTARVGNIGHAAGGQPFITPTNFWFDASRRRIVFHSNLTGRLRSNLEGRPRVCFAANEYGRLLPSNAALEASLQFRSVMAFGVVALIDDPEEKRRALYGMLAKYFPHMQPGREIRPITDQELARTSVYAISIDEWSGKENWNEIAEQTPDWPALPPEILQGSA